MEDVKVVDFVLNGVVNNFSENITMEAYQNLVLTLDPDSIANNLQTIKTIKPEVHRIRYQIDMMKRMIDKYNTEKIDLSDFIVYNVLMIVNNTFDEGLFIESLKNVLGVVEYTTTINDNTNDEMVEKITESMERKLQAFQNSNLINTSKVYDNLKTEMIKEVTDTIKTSIIDLKGHITKRIQEGLSKRFSDRTLGDPPSSSINNKE